MLNTRKRKSRYRAPDSWDIRGEPLHLSKLMDAIILKTMYVHAVSSPLELTYPPLAGHDSHVIVFLMWLSICVPSPPTTVCFQHIIICLHMRQYIVYIHMYMYIGL